MTASAKYGQPVNLAQEQCQHAVVPAPKVLDSFHLTFDLLHTGACGTPRSLPHRKLRPTWLDVFDL